MLPIIHTASDGAVGATEPLSRGTAQYGRSTGLAGGGRKEAERGLEPRDIFMYTASCIMHYTGESQMETLVNHESRIYGNICSPDQRARNLH